MEIYALLKLLKKINRDTSKKVKFIINVNLINFSYSNYVLSNKENLQMIVDSYFQKS